MTGVALAFAATGAFAQGPGHGPGIMGGGHGPGMMGGHGGFAALNLTEGQQDKVFAIREASHGRNFATMSRMRQENFKLHRMMNAESSWARGDED